jgi:prevent-host-death family protein
MSKPKAKNANRITNVIPALTARTQFGQILRRVRHSKERFIVGRRGQPQAVIMGVEEYMKSTGGKVPLLEAIWKDSKAKGLERMSLREINREIKRYRNERRQAKNE